MPRQVWLAPNVAARDLLNLFYDPDSWVQARDRVTHLLLVQWAITYEPNPAAGRNNAAGFISCVSGGAFRWLQEHGIGLAIEAAAVKEWSCGEDRTKPIAALLETLAIIHANGGQVSHIAMDEPMNAGYAASPRGCGYGPERTADETVRFVHAIRTAYPSLPMGLDEAYPEHSATEIIRHLALLAQRGYVPAFFHLDIDFYRARREKKDLAGDLNHLLGACRGQGIPFGVIIWGERGDSNECFGADCRSAAADVDRAVGLKDLDDVVFQSWATTLPSGGGVKIFPDVVPDDGENSHTGLLLEILRRYGA